MHVLKNILVVIEPRQMHQPALERALALRQFYLHREHHESRVPQIVAVLPIVIGGHNLASFLSVERSSDIEHGVVSKMQRWLDAYLNLHAMGIEITKEVVFCDNLSNSPSRQVVRLAKQYACDLIIKTSDVHGVFDALVFTPLDWQLLRYASTPVMIAKDKIWQSSGSIALALDFSSPQSHEQININMRLLREAQQLARLLHMQLHLINAIAPLLANSDINGQGFCLGQGDENSIKSTMVRVLEFAHAHRIDPQNCHFREGSAVDVIPALCHELQPTVLFIGTQGRTGLAVAMLGNICEKVVDIVDCDLVVVTSKSVYSRLPIVK